MKLIDQLVHHFLSRAILSRAQATMLVEKGFLEAWALDSYSGKYSGLIPVPEPIDNASFDSSSTATLAPDLRNTWEQRQEEAEATAALELEARLEKRRAARSPVRKKGGGGKKAKVRRGRDYRPELDALGRRVRALLVSASNRLEPLRFLGGAWPSWHQAAAVLGGCPESQLTQLAGAALEDHALTAAELWSVLAIDVLEQVPPPAGIVGQAYRALLAYPEATAVGKNQWGLRLLGQEPINRAYRLVRAQRRLVQACGRLYEQRPTLLAGALQQSPHPLALWTLLLLYNARGFPWREDPPARPFESWVKGQEALEHARPLKLWQQAWTQALVMDGLRALPLFLHLHQTPLAGPTAVGEALPRPALWCPAGWNALLHQANKRRSAIVEEQ